MSIEAMKQALEALTGNWSTDDECANLHAKQMKAITSLRQAIEAAEKQISHTGNGTAGRENMTAPTGFFFQMPKAEKQEPVAMEKLLHPVLREGGYLTNGQAWILAEKIASLYTTPPAAPVQEPPPGTISTTITTTPQPKREWVGLTDEEIDELEDDRSLETTHDFICAIEAKLKEKNT